MKNLNALFIALAFLGMSATANAQTSGSCGDNLTWTLTGAGSNLTLAISGTGAMTDYIYPPWDSQKENIKTLVLSNGITTIGNNAFLNCSQVAGALTIPNSVTWIGDDAFYGCSGLSGTLIIPDSVTWIGDNAFAGCTGLLGTLTIPNSVTSIGQGAFSDCGLTEVTIGNSVTWIGGGAFAGCSYLTQVTNLCIIPQNIDANVFGYVNLNNATLTVPSCAVNDYQNAAVWNTFHKITGDSDLPCDNYTWHIGYPNAADVTAAISGTGSNLTLTISGTGAMQDFISSSAPWYGIRDNIKTLVINTGVTTIGNYAFCYCSSLTGILTIPNSVTSIGNAAFGDCSGFTELSIGSSVNTIGNLGFIDCSSLTSIKSYKSTPPVSTLGIDAFTDVPNDIPVYVACGMGMYYENDADWSNAFNKFQEMQVFIITVESNDDAMGSASVTQQPDCTNPAIIKATANSGYKFTKWSDNNTDNPRTITLSSDTTLTAIFEVVSGIEKTLLENISIYPNPVKDELKVESGELKVESVEITDLAGRIIINCQLSIVNSLNVSSLPSGIYLVKINTDKGMIVRKFVKN